MPPPFPAIFFVIPVYNEAGNIVRLVESLRAFIQGQRNSYRIRVVLVDDGSQDETTVLAKQAAEGIDLAILTHKMNQGPGRAFGTAFHYLSQVISEDDLVVTMEGDNTSRLTLIDQMLHRLEEGYEVIFASPYMYGGGIKHTNFYRVFLSSMANLFIKELLGIQGLLTVSSFYRMYRAPVLRRMQECYGKEILERSGFECMTEMVMKMVALKIKISEIPMVLDTSVRVGKSRMKILRTIRGYFALWYLRKRWYTLAGRDCSSG